MKQILASAKTVPEIPHGQRYSVDYYQREYRWEAKQARELIDDLTEQLLADNDEADEREAVRGYGHYYLGSIILSDRDGELFIVHG